MGSLTSAISDKIESGEIKTDNFGNQRADIQLQKNYEPVKWLPEKTVQVKYLKNKVTGKWDPETIAQGVQNTNSGRNWEKYMRKYYWPLGTYKAVEKIENVVVPGQWEDSRVVTSYASISPATSYVKEYLVNSKKELDISSVPETGYGATQTTMLNPSSVLKEAYEIIDPETQSQIDRTYSDISETEAKIQELKTQEERILAQQKAQEERIRNITPTLSRAKSTNKKDFQKQVIRNTNTNINKIDVGDFERKISRPTQLNRRERPTGQIMRSK